MPVLNSLQALAPQMTAWRRALHQIPELQFALPKTAAYVAERLREIGVDEIHEGIASSGIVAIINGQKAGPTIGLRSDMDALPIHEDTGADYASQHAGRAHSCGHDGHMAMLLGAAHYLAQTRAFAGRVALIFQPAEEDGGGAQVMVREGIMERFEVQEVYGLHNAPNLPLGEFQTCAGPILAAVDTVWIKVTGRGGHGAMPQDCIDPIPAMAAMVSALQTVVSRNVAPHDALVVTVTQMHAGTASNIIPESGKLCMTVRSFTPEIRARAEARIRAIIEGQAQAFGVSAAIDYVNHYPPTVNDPQKAAFAADVARLVSDHVQGDITPWTAAEDFSYMLQARPGAFIFLGTGEGAGLHHAAFDFNDEAAPYGASYFAKLVERALPL